MKRFLSILFAGTMIFAGIGCEAEVEKPGKMPKVKVEGGEMPEVDVDAPEVKVDKQQITVPDVDVIPADKDGDG